MLQSKPDVCLGFLIKFKRGLIVRLSNQSLNNPETNNLKDNMLNGKQTKTRLPSDAFFKGK